jgi:hypothetical protein
LAQHRVESDSGEKGEEIPEKVDVGSQQKEKENKYDASIEQITSQNLSPEVLLSPITSSFDKTTFHTPTRFDFDRTASPLPLQTSALQNQSNSRSSSRRSTMDGSVNSISTPTSRNSRRSDTKLTKTKMDKDQKDLPLLDRVKVALIDPKSLSPEELAEADVDVAGEEGRLQRFQIVRLRRQLALQEEKCKELESIVTITQKEIRNLSLRFRHANEAKQKLEKRLKSLGADECQDKQRPQWVRC